MLFGKDSYPLRFFDWQGTDVYCYGTTKLDISSFSLKNTFTTEQGKTVIYPIKNRKTKLNFAVEIQGDYKDENGDIVKNLSKLMYMLHCTDFFCEFKMPENDYDPWKEFTGTDKQDIDTVIIKAYVKSDISVTKVMSENAVKGGLYIVSAMLEEV